MIVGDSAIPLGVFQPKLDAALHSGIAQQVISQGADPTLVARFFATQSVNHELTTQQAKALGVQVKDVDVDALIAAAGGPDRVSSELGVLGGPADVKEAVRDYLLRAEIGKKILPGLVVVTDLVPAASRADAEHIAAELAKGGSAADKVLATPGAQKAVATVGATNPDAAAQPPFGVPPGSVVAFQPSPDQAGWLVARVLERRTNGPKDAAAIGQISTGQLASIGRRYVQLKALESGGVRLNPRYGVWDPVGLQAVQTPADITGEIIAPGA